jgi:hypothetical protein
VFLRYRKRKVTTLIIYLDDTKITNNDAEEIQVLQENMTAKFEIQNPEGLKYFLGNEVARLARDILRKIIINKTFTRLASKLLIHSQQSYNL